MSRFLLALGGVVLLIVTALGALWLAGEVLVGAGLVAVGTAGLLLKLLWFLLVAGALGALVYFVAYAWRPARAAFVAANQPSTPALRQPHDPQEAALVLSAVPQVRMKEAGPEAGRQENLS